MKLKKEKKIKKAKKWGVCAFERERERKRGNDEMPGVLITNGNKTPTPHLTTHMNCKTAFLIFFFSGQPN